jgi:hypothetical protein
MTRIRFEDLPSRNTPRNAENLNKLNNVVISPTEPTTGEEVWLKKSNNLLNVGSSFVVNTSRDIYMPLEAGTYTLYVGSTTTTSPSATCHIGFTNATGGKFLIKYLEKGSNKKITFTLDQDAVQLTIWSGDYWNQSKDYSTTFNNLMLVKGDVELPYGAYVDKKIYVKNDNGVYDKFYDETNLENYSTEERRIGTWIDGKPLYRKVISCGALPNATSKSVAHGIANLDTFTSVRGIAMATNYKYTKTLPSATPSDLKGAIGLDVSDTSIFISTGLDRTEYTKSYVILEYTKN